MSSRVTCSLSRRHKDKQRSSDKIAGTVASTGIFVATGRPRTDWVRKSNCPGGPGTAPGNKYGFSRYLKQVGDFIESYPMSREDRDKMNWAAWIWAYRHHCRIKTEAVYYADGYATRIEIISNTRKERK